MQKISSRFLDIPMTFGFDDHAWIERKRKGIRTVQLKARFKSHNKELIDTLNRENGVILSEKTDETDSVLLHFPAESKESLATIIKSYVSSGLVEYIEPHVMLGLQNSRDLLERPPALNKSLAELDGEYFNDTHYHLQWPFNNTGQFDGTPGEDIGLEQAYRYIGSNQISLQKNQVRVAVLDDGVDPKHLDLNPNNFVDGFDLMDNDDKPVPSDLLTHGTNIAGVISGIGNNRFGIAGINPETQLIVGRIYGRSASAHLPQRAAIGIRKAVDLKARIINLSWGIDNPSAEILDAIQYAREKDVLVVAAAGNYYRARDTEVMFPGRLDSVLTVGACDHKGRWINLNNCLANPKFGSRYGRSLDLVAPGYNIITTQYDHPQYPNQLSFNLFHGTSVATAIVSAVASLLLMIHPVLSSRELRELLLSNTDDIRSKNPDSVGFDHLGHGRINAFKAVKALHKILETT